MGDRLEDLERRVDELARQLHLLTSEVRSLRAGSAFASEAPAAPEGGGPAPLPEEEDWAISRDVEALLARHGLVLLAGLVSLALAGGLVLRMVAMSDLVRLELGAGLGLVYCGFLALVANRMLRKGARLHGDTFAILSILILVALLVEVAHRRDGLTPVAALWALGGGLVVLTAIALRRNRPAPFVVLLLAVPVAGAAIGGRPFPHPWYAGVLALTILAGLAGTAWRGWSRARWGPGLMSLAYLLVLGQIARATAIHDLPHHVHARPAPALAVLAAFFLLHVTPALRATCIRSRPLDAYEIVMAVGAALLGYAGAMGILVGLPGSGGIVAGLSGLGLMTLFYAAAFVGYVRQGAESRNFYALSSIGFLLALGAFPVLLGAGAFLGLAYQALGLALAVLAARLGKRTLSFQAHVLGLAAFLALFATVLRLRPPAVPGPAAGGWILATGALGVAAFARLRSFVPPGEGFTLRRFRVGATALVLVLAAALLEVSAGAVDLLTTPAASILGLSADAEACASLWLTLQTLVLATAAVATLAVGVRLRLGGVTVLAVALTGGTGLKLFLVDALRVPATYLVASAGAFGLTLILSSFVYRRSRGLGEAGEGAPNPPLSAPGEGVT